MPENQKANGGQGARNGDHPQRLGTFYRAELLKRLEVSEVRGVVLDIGGFDGYWVAGLGDVERYVADISPWARYAAVRYIRADALRLPFKDSTFDAVFTIDVIEHVGQERQMVAEALRVLRPGGKLILTTPSATIRVAPFFIQRWIDRRWGHTHVRGYREDYLGALLREHGGCHVKVTPVAMTALRWLYLLLVLAWRLPGPFGRFLVSAVASWDARHLEGPHGALLLTATR